MKAGSGKSYSLVFEGEGCILTWLVGLWLEPSRELLLSTERTAPLSGNAAWDDIRPISPYTSPSMSSIATTPTSLGSGHPDCPGIASGSSISVLGTIAMGMTHLSDAYRL